MALYLIYKDNESTSNKKFLGNKNAATGEKALNSFFGKKKIPPGRYSVIPHSEHSKRGIIKR